MALRRGIRTEPVAECVDLIEAALPDRNISIAGYDNDCLGCLTAERAAEAGSHENRGVTIRPWRRDLRRHAGLFAHSLERVVVSAVARMVRRRKT
ncbi:MAG: hypothetical protein OXN97_25450 [Bryobacterales bacterium]|nr:hypothetical protein [Bryobacterales bacterium]MDE0626105.1 hypothetical protein [Bryobacterales bacterium]